MKETKKTNWNNLIKWLPGIIISGIAVFILSRFINLDELRHALSSFRIDSLVIIILLFFLSMLARAIAWRSMLGKKANVKDSFFGVCIGYLLNNIIPRSGEIGKAVIMGTSTGLGFIHVLSTVIIERALDLAIAAIMFLSTLPLVLQMDWLKPIAIVMLLVVISSLIVLFLMANNKKEVHGWLTEKLKNNTIAKKYLLPGLESLLNGFGVLTKFSQFIIVVFWISMSWLGWTIIFYTALVLLVPHAPFWWAIFCEAVLAMGIALPSAPAGLGIYEGTMVVALSVFAVPQSDSLGIALVLHLVQIVLSSILGIIGLLRQGWSLKKIIDQIGIKKTS